MARPWLLVALLAVGAGALSAAQTGSVAGRVTTGDGIGLAGVAVTCTACPAAAVSDAQGRYRLEAVPAGTHDLVLSLGALAAGEPGVAVAAGGTTEVTTAVDWDTVFGGVLTVQAASRYRQRFVEAPAAVTSVTAEAIQRRASFGQVPRLLADAAAAELPQAGLYDYNLNTRGFNGSTNRRILTLVDGVDTSQAVFAGAQEWAALAFGLDELESVELIYGPGAALYGAGAYNGVLDLRTRTPRRSLGGRLRLAGGELATRRVEGRWAGGSDRSGFAKLVGGWQESDDFLRSRVGGAEYGGGTLPAEAIAPPRDRVELGSGAVRWERDLGTRWTLDLGGGRERLEGTSAVTGLGRLQRQRVDRTWGRAEVAGEHANLLASYGERDSDGEVSLSAGSAIFLAETRAAVEGQAHGGFQEGRGRLVGGASWTRLRVDSADPRGAQTLFTAPVESEHEAVFGQAEYDPTPRLHAVASLRWDGSDLHDDQVSPRLAVVWAVGANRSLRLTYSEAFQSPTLSEKHVIVPIAAPLDLSGLETALAPLLGGVPLGLGSVPLVAVGNRDLGVEEVTSWELGYSGTLGDRSFLTVSAYRSRLTDFTTNLVPVLGTGLGQLVHPPLWQPPAGLSPAAAAAVRAALAAALPADFLLAADAAGNPYVPYLSFGTFGRVDTTGVDVALASAWNRWRLDVSASWFDHEVQLEAAVNPLLPNRAEWQAALGAGWVGERLDAHAGWRWSDGFDFRSGVFVGPVPAYSVVDLTANWRIGDHWSAGLTVANALDDEHYEMFGGDLLRRRALASVTWSG